MTDSTATEMDAIEIADFLETQRTGVLSLAKDDDGYAIPVSFVYDDAGPHVYLRLGFAPGSQKRKYLDETAHGSFVVYDETDEGWKSVVVEGTFEELSSSTLDSSILEAVNSLEIPFLSVHKRPVDDTQFTIVRMTITTVNGLVEGKSKR
jgi:hypothetical protein